MRAFVSDIPERGSGAYDPPIAGDLRTFGSAVSLLLAGQVIGAGRLLDPLGYQVERFYDRQSQRRLVVVREVRAADGSWPHGWGLFVFDLQAASEMIVEVPHPLYDVKTPQVGVDLFDAAHAEALLVAGTHRYADADRGSDVAHADGSVFGEVNRRLADDRSVVVQPHGFDESEHAGDGDVVVSGGIAPPPAHVKVVGSGLTQAGFEVCVFGADAACDDLGGTDNLQGRWVRRVEGLFLHIEISRTIRDDPEAVERLATVVAAGLHT